MIVGVFVFRANREEDILQTFHSPEFRGDIVGGLAGRGQVRILNKYTEYIGC